MPIEELLMALERDQKGDDGETKRQGGLVAANREI